MIVYKFEPLESFDPLKTDNNYAEKIMHIKRYYLSAEEILSSNNNNSARVLDAACGTGYGSYVTNKKTGLKVIGVDINKKTLKYASQNYHQKNISFEYTNIKNIPYKDNFFDFVLCYETIEHVNLKDGQIIIKELKRVMKPGAYLYISSPNKYFTQILRIIGWGNPFHLYEYYPWELKKTLEQHGLVIIKKWGQSLLFLPTYYLARRKIISSKYFSPSIIFPVNLSMYFIYKCIKK